MNIIQTESATWRRAKKTKGLRAKPMINLLVDRSVMSKFLIDTLEGREPIGPDTMFCIGDAGDAWQQEASKLLKKYNVTSIDSDGWMVCDPRPENEVEFFEFTADMMDGSVQVSMPGMDQETVIQGQWGETFGEHTSMQRVKLGDFICRQPYDHTDQWVVHRKLFNNTYSVLGE